MKEIKLIVSQEKLEQNRKNQILKDETKKNYERMNKTTKGIITIAVLTLTILWLGYAGMNMKEEAYNNCMENGYSQSYCLKNS